MLVNVYASNATSTQVRIYGDGRLIYTSPILSQGTIPVPFNIDTSGVLLMQIVVESTGGAWSRHIIGIVDARFEQH